MKRCHVQAVGMVSALGSGVDQTRARLMSGDTRGMTIERDWVPNADACVGRVTAELPALPERLALYDCRNNRLLAAALRQIHAPLDRALERHGAARIAVIIGTSTSGIASGERAIAEKLKRGEFPPSFDYVQQEIGATAPFAAKLAGACGPTYTISTACTSGAKALIAARRLLDLGLCDAALAGGVDTLCRLTVCGFTALESAAPERCNPMSRNRSGTNIGEGAALFLLSRESAAVTLAGGGESTDAYHLSAPDPQGTAPELAMRRALAQAGARAEDVAYVNLHATATRKNDEMESRVMARLFSPATPMSGTKPLTGHALGAAGALEAAVCWLALTGDGTLPPHVWDGEADPELPALHLVARGERLAKGHGHLVMSNSFAFGGSNVALLFSD